MCQLCKTKPVYEFTNKRKLCRGCFVKYFQKKVLYIIRKFGMIKNNDVIGYENSGDFRGVVLEDVLKMFAKRARIELIKLRSPQARDIDKKLINNKKISKIAIPLTIDIEANEIIHTLIKGKVKDLKNIAPVVNKIIKPLYLFLDEEVLIYAKLRRLKFGSEQSSGLVRPSVVERKKDKITKFIDELEKKHPEVKMAVVKSYLKLYYF